MIIGLLLINTTTNAVATSNDKKESNTIAHGAATQRGSIVPPQAQDEPFQRYNAMDHALPFHSHSRNRTTKPSPFQQYHAMDHYHNPTTGPDTIKERRSNA
eukprot:76976_1